MQQGQGEIRILSPNAILGYGFPVKSFEAGIAKKPHLIAVDAGSTDPGPYYLGSGKSFTDRAAVKRDLELILMWGISCKIKVTIGTAGGAGANAHLEWCLDIIKEIAKEKELNFKMGIIEAEVTKEEVRRRLTKNEIEAFPNGSRLSQEELEDTCRVVGQMGVEPFINALSAGVDVIVAGRAYDPAVFACYPVLEGYDSGLSLHLAKILECACIAADPGSGSDCMMGYLRDDHFLVEPLNPDRIRTCTSVAAHTLYEKANPYLLKGPGGTLDLTDTVFEQLDERTVKVSGSRFVAGEKYTVKLEGAKRAGSRTICIAGARDPVFIAEIDNIIEQIKEMVRENFGTFSERYSLLFRLYGRDGVMGELEPLPETTCHELGIIIEVIADTQELANTICSFARSSMLHFGYSGRMSTGGNLAFPYSPSDIEAGEVYQFSIHHLIELNDPCELFPLRIEEVKA